MFKTLMMKGFGLTVFSLFCLTVFVGVCALMLRTAAPDTVTVGGDSYPLTAENEGDIAAFLEVCGYPAEELISQKEITVPKHWNEVYTDYNELQRAQGFDLAGYKGKPAQELVYACADEEYVTLLIGGGRIIAAHICASDGGDMRPLINNGE